jgi:hypothetical protein
LEIFLQANVPHLGVVGLFFARLSPGENHLGLARIQAAGFGRIFVPRQYTKGRKFQPFNR